jgi:hypothetical protein
MEGPKDGKDPTLGSSLSRLPSRPYRVRDSMGAVERGHTLLALGHYRQMKSARLIIAVDEGHTSAFEGRGGN